MAIRFGVALAVAGSAFLTAGVASAQETGLHKIHDLARQKGKLCMVDHEHAGESPPSGNKSVAVKLAINKWVQFTADEYGKSWGSWKAAAGKKETCSGGPGNVVCMVTARPCKSGR
jgi:hypothetical protein